MNKVESFLLHLEQEESRVFNECPDYIIVPFIPFFQLVHVLNIEEVIDLLLTIEEATNGAFIRDEGYLSLALDECVFDEMDVSRMGYKLFNIMRF